MSHSLTLRVTSTHSHTLLMCQFSCTHTHIHPPGPKHPCLLPKGITWGAPWRQGFLGLHAECPRGCGAGGETLPGSPWVWAELLGGPSSFSGSPASPLPNWHPLPPKAWPWGQVAESDIWTLPAAASSQESRIAGWPSATGQLGKKHPSLGIPIRTQIKPLLCIWLSRVNTGQVTPGGGTLD